MKIAIVGPAHYGIAEPFAGGLEAHTYNLAKGLRLFGHDVTVFAGPRTARRPPNLRVHPILDQPIDFSQSARCDNAMPPGRCTREDNGYRRLIYTLDSSHFDIIHNNSLHYLVPGLDHLLDIPVVHTLHTPPFAWLRDAHVRRAQNNSKGVVVAISQSLARQWNGLADLVILNGVPIPSEAKHSSTLHARRQAIWVGRLVPEKAPHLAIDAARQAGFHINLYGPAQHKDYFSSKVEPRLGPTAQWHGHRDQDRLRAAMKQSNVGLVTPCWDEPFGLTTAEMSAIGLPVAGFDRGATREILTARTGRLARPNDVDHLAELMAETAVLKRSDCRSHAAAVLDEDLMVRRYEQLYERLIANPSGLELGSKDLDNTRRCRTSNRRRDLVGVDTTNSNSLEDHVLRLPI